MNEIWQFASWATDEMVKNDVVLTNVLANKMAFNLHIFGAFMKNIVVGNAARMDVVTVKGVGCKSGMLQFTNKTKQKKKN